MVSKGITVYSYISIEGYEVEFAVPGGTTSQLKIWKSSRGIFPGFKISQGGSYGGSCETVWRSLIGTMILTVLQETSREVI